MCKFEKHGFPGSQPVSMDLNNIRLLQDKPYRVSWKADGTRYMMLIKKENEIYFFDRDNACFQVSGIRFPNREDLKTHIYDTLIDGVSIHLTSTHLQRGFVQESLETQITILQSFSSLVRKW